ncbi:MAG: hypothetical protein Q8P24_02260 [Desulfobacterales bacterium]|nr:hypothetical protein [Desulfobacterales bacterium]
MPNRRLNLTGIPLRFIPAGEATLFGAKRLTTSGFPSVPAEERLSSPISTLFLNGSPIQLLWRRARPSIGFTGSPKKPAPNEPRVGFQVASSLSFIILRFML